MITARSGYDVDYNCQEYTTSKKSHGLREILICSGIIFFIASLFILYLYQSIQYAELSYELQMNKMELEELRKENQHLVLERSRLATIERIERIAHKELGMHHPSEIEFVHLDQETGTQVVDTKRVDVMLKGLVFNWLENISRVEAGTLYD